MSPSRRNSLRLSCYDYRAGWFFLTLCSFGRRPLFGDIMGAELRISTIGQCVLEHFRRVPIHRPDCTVHELALMPDHLHAILEMRRSMRGGLGTVISHFKRGVSLEITGLGLLTAGEVWQRGYYERVIRSSEELHQTRLYIRENLLASVVGPRISNRIQR